MFCPICRTEYREGFQICSDCRADLVARLPEPDEPTAYRVLWTGESGVFQDHLLAELEQAQIGAAGIPLHRLFARSADEFGISRDPRLGFAVCTQNADLLVARQILEKLLGEKPEEIQPDAEAIPFSSEESETIPELPLNWDSSAATVCLWEGEDKSRLEFLEHSLNGVGIPTLREMNAASNFKLLIRPQEEKQAREVLEQIATNTAPKKDLYPYRQYAWLDEPIKSYRLLWMLAVPFVFLMVLIFDLTDVASAGSPLNALLKVMEILMNVGILWMIYQAVRYEIRTLRFIVIALCIPLSFVWYYFERYSKRTGVNRLPIAIRMRMSPPTST